MLSQAEAEVEQQLHDAATQLQQARSQLEALKLEQATPNAEIHGGGEVSDATSLNGGATELAALKAAKQELEVQLRDARAEISEKQSLLDKITLQQQETQLELEAARDAEEDLMHEKEQVCTTLTTALLALMCRLMLSCHRGGHSLLFLFISFQINLLTKAVTSKLSQ